MLPAFHRDASLHQVRQTTNEAMATEKKAEKAKHFLDAVEKIAHLILPLTDEIKTPLTNKIPEAAI